MPVSTIKISSVSKMDVQHGLSRAMNEFEALLRKNNCRVVNANVGDVVDLPGIFGSYEQQITYVWEPENGGVIPNEIKTSYVYHPTTFGGKLQET